MTGREVADRLCISESTVRLWAKQGVLPSVRISARTIRYRHADVEALIERSGDSGAEVA